MRAEVGVNLLKKSGVSRWWDAEGLCPMGYSAITIFEDYHLPVSNSTGSVQEAPENLSFCLRIACRSAAPCPTMRGLWLINHSRVTNVRAIRAPL